jgi:hypothetical protein
LSHSLTRSRNITKESISMLIKGTYEVNVCRRGNLKRVFSGSKSGCCDKRAKCRDCLLSYDIGYPFRSAGVCHLSAHIGPTQVPNAEISALISRAVFHRSLILGAGDELGRSSLYLLVYRIRAHSTDVLRERTRAMNRCCPCR